MEFNNIVKKQFENAGWELGRSVINVYNNLEYFNDLPNFLQQFLGEYGDLKVLDAKLYKAEVTNELHIKPNRLGIASREEEGFKYITSILGIELYEFAYFYPDHYYIACDSEGKVYMLGDYVFHIANTLKEGIEILIEDDWSHGYLELNEETGNWLPSDSYSGWNN